MKRKKTQSHPISDRSFALAEAAAQLEQAETFRQKRNFDRAESICANLVRQHPTYFGALYTFGLIAADKKDYGRALMYLLRALIQNSRSVLALNALSGVLIELDAKELASKMLEIALARSPNDALLLVTVGELYREELEYEQAIKSFRRAIALDNSLREASLGLALSLQSIGHPREAARLLEDLLQKRQSSIDSLFALAQLPRSVVTVNLLEALNEQIKHAFEDAETFNNISLFIRAIALDQVGRHEEAWNAMLKANRELDIKATNEIHSLKTQEAETQRWIESNKTNILCRSSADHATSLFILGPSRSGKTSLEYSVSRLASVKRGYESKIVGQATRSAFQSAGLIDTFPLIYLPHACYPAFFESYFSELDIAGSAKHVVTNTNPSNIHNICALFSIIPNVRVVFIKRDIEDIMLRIFMYRYKGGNAYAYNLNSIREHVLWYYGIMDTIAEQLPAIAKIVSYEDFVANPTKTVRSVADLCAIEMVQDFSFDIGDDRGCAAPYRERMLGELDQSGRQL